MKVVAVYSINGSVAMGVTEMEDELHTLQRFVGGPIEAVNPFENFPEIVCVCDEEGRLKRKPVTVDFDCLSVCGNCFFCEEDEWGGFTSLREEYVEMLLEAGGE